MNRGPLDAWPLLTVGLALLTADVALLLSDGVERSIAGALLLGVGSVMVGAGIGNVLWHNRDRRGPPRD